jgi:hypothetical protein
MDLELRLGQGVGALLAWPLLQTAQALLESGGSGTANSGLGSLR